MTDIFSLLTPNIAYFWLILALVFLLLEISTPGLFLFVTFAIGSILASIVAFLDYSLFVQCITLILGFLASFLIIKLFLKSKESKRVNTTVDALVGRICLVTKKIDKNNSGLVKVDGEVWAAVGKDDKEFLPGQNVKIVVVKGNKLIVS
ncbi:NfeD family protein [Candidatus Dependentiae bacterium]|nr:NfeD family protein [Candidatus Dependentiae bacterium]MBU4387177.1 NfeD family protein [Candidatus Dependentiae bacterium]MCG2755934.1 NfeD family protein [Candidatus Dependentiae bacterium]